MEYGVVPALAVAVVSALIMTLIFVATNRQPWRGIAVDEAIARQARIVDVRSPQEFAEGHVAGAENLPVERIDEWRSQLGRDRPVIVYCASGARSARAAKVLRADGIDVVDAATFRAFPEALWPAWARDAG